MSLFTVGYEAQLVAHARYVLLTPIQPFTRVKISLLFYQAFDAHLALYYVRYRSHVFNVRVF